MDGPKLWMLFDRVARKLFKRLAYIYQREGLLEVDIPVLWEMSYKQACRVSELSREIPLSPSTVTGVLDRLVAKGLLERIPDPRDRRSIIMKITPRASDLVQRMRATFDKELETILSVLPDDRLQELMESTQLILDFLEHDQR